MKMYHRNLFYIKTPMIREKKMKLPRFIQKWIRKQFDNKTVCDRCLQPYTTQTMKGDLLCNDCLTVQQETNG